MHGTFFKDVMYHMNFDYEWFCMCAEDVVAQEETSAKEEEVVRDTNVSASEAEAGGENH